MRSLLVAISLVLAACGHEGVSAETQHWHCEGQQCTVDFLLINASTKHQQVAYVLRAHAIRSVIGTGGAKRQETVGELHAEVELLGLEQRRMEQTLPVNGQPYMIVTTAWVLD